MRLPRPVLAIALLASFCVLVGCGSNNRSSRLIGVVEESLAEDAWSQFHNETYDYIVEIPTFWFLTENTVNARSLTFVSDTTGSPPLEFSIKVHSSNATTVKEYIEDIDATLREIAPENARQILSESFGPIDGQQAVLRKEYYPASDSVGVSAYALHDKRVYVFRFHIAAGLPPPYDLNKDEQQLLIELLSSVRFL